jgi:two-component system, LytTR family, sensor kinase
MEKRLFKGKQIRFLLHVLAWFILLAVPFYLTRRWQIGNDFLILFYTNALISGIIFYTNYFLLVPKLFFANRRFRYYVSVAVLLSFFFVVSDQTNMAIFKSFGEPGKIEKQGPPPDQRVGHRPPFEAMHKYNYGFNAIFLVFFSLGLRILERHSEIEKAQKELEKEKLNSELAFLKNQISPHFFFNTLNNIYSLIAINAEDSQKAVLKLSKMMRYLLYESEKGDAKLSSEIDFMNNYIDLMRLRMSDKVSLKVDFPEKYTDYTLPPLLFISFIENAFKHGISFRDKSFIEISLVSDESGIFFRSRNSVSPAAGEGQADSSGIGLGNVRKRLELLFPGKHDLKIEEKDSTFTVELKIDMKA